MNEGGLIEVRRMAHVPDEDTVFYSWTLML